MAEGYPHVFVEPPSKDLRWQCHICQGILRKPVLVTCCGGKFCFACISKWRDQEKLECPLCREKYELAPEKDLERVLLDKEVLCSPRDHGCQWRGELRKVDKHEKNDCQYVIVGCPYGCGDKVLRLNVEIHKQKCHKRPQPCEFSIYGCQKMIPFNEEEAHRKSHSQHHLTLVLSKLNKKEKELQMARKDVLNYQAKVCQMEKHVSETEERCKLTEETLQQAKEELHMEKKRCKKSDESLRQIQGELQQARENIVVTQMNLYEIEQYCQETEEALEEAEGKLCTEQEKCKKMHRSLDQTRRKLQKTRSNVSATKDMLHMKKEQYEKTEEALQETEAKLYLEQQRHEENNKLLQETQTDLQEAKRSVMTHQKELHEKERHIWKLAETLEEKKGKYCT